MYKYEYMTLTQLGQLFGVTSHQLGRWLVDIELRNEKKRPSQKAFDGDYCKTGPSRGDGYNWIWNTKKTVEALTEAGHKLVSPPPLGLVEPPRLVGPFTLRKSGEGMIEIVGGDGSVTTFVIGEENAKLVRLFLNAAHRMGKVGSVTPLSGVAE